LSNALLAIGAAERVVGEIDELDRAAADVHVAGRFEVYDVADKRVILDVAHNDDALIATLRTLRALSPANANALVLGVLARKELIDFPRSLPESVARIYLVQPERDEWFTAPSLLDEIQLSNVRDSSLDVVLQRCFEEESDWRRFIYQAIVAGPHPVVLITGSHQMVELFGRRLPHVGEQGRN
jgi:folylpolyglutamate synthase/dihydropteroate synthase